MSNNAKQHKGAHRTKCIVTPPTFYIATVASFAYAMTSWIIYGNFEAGIFGMLTVIALVNIERLRILKVTSL